MMLGAAIGALFNGWSSPPSGANTALMVGRCCLLPVLVSAFATSVERCWWQGIVLGVAVGIATRAAVPVGNSERNACGKTISMYQLMVTLGIVMAFLPTPRSATAATGGRAWHWRCRRGADYSGDLPPNSPRWLAEKGVTWKRCRGCRARTRQKKNRDELNDSASLKLKQGGWALFKVNRNAAAVFPRMLLQAMQ